jgi:DNA repair protein NreA
MSTNVFEMQVSLMHKPILETSFDSFTAPLGPSAKLNKINLLENPSIPKEIDHYNSDTDAKANTALIDLFKKGFPVSTLAKVLSSGALGVKKHRKIVPTRWSITATEDNIGKHFIEKIKEFSLIDSIQVFEDTYFDNKFIILLLPKPWSFEQLECWVPGSIWNMESDPSKAKIIHDHEFFDGQKGYANNVTGAYYAVRLSILEYLMENKKQAMVVAFREIGEGYKLPLGSWVCGETAKAAMKKEPKLFSNLELAFEYIGKKLKVPIQKWKQESVVLDFYNKQKTLFDF